MNLTRKYMQIAKSLFSLAHLITLISNFFGWYHVDKLTVERTRLDIERQRLTIEKTRLANQREALKIQREHNALVKEDQAIELAQLKIDKEKWEQRNAGIGAPTFTADNYAEPGDIRHGQP